MNEYFGVAIKEWEIMLSIMEFYVGQGFNICINAAIFLRYWLLKYLNKYREKCCKKI